MTAYYDREGNLIEDLSALPAGTPVFDKWDNPVGVIDANGRIIVKATITFQHDLGESYATEIDEESDDPLP
jgi:hypothetical protein